ncbi:MAG: hypothetical protein BIFFINMI_01320 [Phycisphaerae bacterium]|nr:hypothetical protein [Phycisphaerae bacterium]
MRYALRTAAALAVLAALSSPLAAADPPTTMSDECTDPPQSLSMLVAGSSSIARIEIGLAADGKVPLRIVQTLKGKPPAVPASLPIPDEKEEAGAFDLGTLVRVKVVIRGLLFVAELPDPDEYDRSRPRKIVTVRLLYLNMSDNGWPGWFRLYPPDEYVDRWELEPRYAPSGGWMGTLEMLDKAVRAMIAQPDKVDWPIFDQVEYKPLIRVAKVTGRVADLLWVDLCGDGRRVVLVLSDAGDRAFRYDTKEGTFVDVTADLKLATKSTRAAIADFNGDGRLDLASWTGRTLDICLQSKAGTFDARPASSALAECLDLSAIDAGSDGRAALLVSGPGIPRLATPDADGAIRWRAVVDWPPGRKFPPTDGSQEKDFGDAKACVVADFTGDARADILQPFAEGGLLYARQADGSFAAPAFCGVASAEPRESVVWDKDDPARGTPVPYAGGWLRAGRGPVRGRTGDFDADGLLDALLYGPDEGTRPWRNAGGGRFDGPYPAGALDYINNGIACIGDINNDGRQDILMVGGNGTLHCVVGQGFFHFAWAGAATASWYPLTWPKEGEPFAQSAGQQAGLLADLDGDGAQESIVVMGNGDLWVGYPHSDEPRFKTLAVRASLPPGGRFAGPLTVTGWSAGRCLGAWNVTHAAPAFFAGRTPADMKLRWQYPGRPLCETTLRVEQGLVDVQLTPTGLTTRPAD